MFSIEEYIALETVEERSEFIQRIIHDKDLWAEFSQSYQKYMDDWVQEIRRDQRRKDFLQTVKVDLPIYITGAIIGATIASKFIK